MLKVFKLTVLCLIFIFTVLYITSLLITAIFLILFAILFYDYDPAVEIQRHAIDKVQNVILKVRTTLQTAHFSNSRHTDSFQYTPVMNNINRDSVEFDLSRFNKSGSVYSPISSYGSNVTASRRNIQNRQTSTPLNKNLPFQRDSLQTTNLSKSPRFQNSVVQQSPKYSLSSYNITPTKNNYESLPKPTIQTVTGPLLASTRFNVNLGTYTDSKSPGLASRIIQYSNNLQNNQQNTHQAKYGSPGQFPIVQLYKRDHPILTRTPRRCTVRIAPPDILTHNSAEANAILKDSFVQKPTKTNDLQIESEISTKSVLEALKEISRKRIHSNDDSLDVNKRQRKGSFASPVNNSESANKDGKRLRENTPPNKEQSSSPSTTVTKKVCVVSDIESSLSSTKHLLQGTKRKAATSSVNINKQRKLTNDELVSKQTQTQVSSISSEPSSSTTQSSKSTETQESVQQTSSAQTEVQTTDLQIALYRIKQDKEEQQRKCDEELKLKKKEEKPKSAPIFRQEPLQIMKRNKIAALFASLNGTEPELIPVPEYTISELKKIIEEEEENKKKGTPESTSTLHSILSPKNKTKHDKHVTFSIPVLEETTSTSEPIVQTPKKSTMMFGIEFTSSESTTTTTFTNPIKLGELSMPTFKISTTSEQTSLTSPFSMSQPFEPPKLNLPTFRAVTTTTLANNTISTPAVSNSEKPNKSPVITSPINTNAFGSKTAEIPALMFGGQAPSTSEKSDNVTTTPLTFNFPTSANTTSAPSLLGNIAPSPFCMTTTPSTQTTVAFNAPKMFSNMSTLASTVTSNTSGTSLGTYNFNSKTTSAVVPPGFAFGPSNVQSAPQVGGFKFDLNKPAVTSTVTSNEPPKNIFGDSNLKPGSFTFGSNNNSVTTTSMPTTSSNVFSSSTSAPLTFGTPKTESSFGTKSVSFGTSTTQSTGFGGSGTQSVDIAQTSGFGITSTQSTAFGIPTTQNNSFVIVTTQSNVFGAPTTQSTFGASSQNITFGAPTTQSGFGAPTTQSGFGAPTTQSGFGTATTQSGFGISTTQAQPFGAVTTTQANTFSTFTTPTTTASFAFGQTTQNSAFAAPTTNALTFGSNTNAVKPFSFGTAVPATTSSGVFGFGNSAPTNTFGVTTTTTASSTFGQTSSNIFGSGSTFSSPGSTTASVFGQANNNFNAQGAASSSFGTANQTNAFSTNNNQNNNVFGAPSSNNNNNNTGLGSQSTNFGQGSAFGTTNNNNTFGSGFSNNNQPPSFGSFATPTTQTSAPTAGVFAFGASQPVAPQPTASSNAFQFGATAATKPAGFNFSVGTTAPNLNFGGAPPAFNANQPPAFGAQQPGQFNAPAGQMFSIGSGSTAPKQRPMMKARRRN